jgi:hypothetical protein
MVRFRHIRLRDTVVAMDRRYVVDSDGIVIDPSETAVAKMRRHPNYVLVDEKPEPKPEPKPEDVAEDPEPETFDLANADHDALKEKAKDLGINPGNMKPKTLRKKIAAALKG